MKKIVEKNKNIFDILQLHKKLILEKKILGNQYGFPVPLTKSIETW
jgi:hypothetical protein